MVRESNSNILRAEIKKSLNALGIVFACLGGLTRLLSFSALLLAILMSGFSLLAYEIDGTKWIGGKTTFYIDVEGDSISDITWNAAVKGALADWSGSTQFEFEVVEEYKDPCLIDFVNSTDFTDDVCGSEFGENVLAVTLLSFESQELGPPAIVESDIVVNSSRSFDIYNGPLGTSKGGVFAVDYGRVMLHELGHAIGLGHEENNQAIMAPRVGDIDRLQEDDIAGVNHLYSGLSNCDVTPLVFGSMSGALRAGDCTVSEMTVGGTDESFIDLYQFEVNEQNVDFDFSVKGGNLDAVLLIATEDLEYLSVDALSTEDCDSSLSRRLGAGSYFLMVNTYDRQIKEDCSTTGQYLLTSAFTQSEIPILGTSTSLLGGYSEATFTGGVSKNDHDSYGNVFDPYDSLDIRASIEIDKTHIGQTGFILVAAILSDQFLMLDSLGQFIDTGFNPDPFVVHKRKTLEAEEEISIVKDLVPAELGIEEIEVNIVVGYGLDSNSAEVYYHQTPINFIVKKSAPWSL